MIFRQFVDDDLGCASYLVGDERAGAAAVVDPAYAIEPYLEEAGRLGVEIVKTLETHTHADHVSGHGRLALEHDVPVAVHPLARADHPWEPLDDGAELALGDVRLRVLHTPGHRPEHCSLVVDEQLVLTGDSLFVGAVGRPDLAVDARDGARALFASLRRLGALPDDTRVYPGHVAGSLCGAGLCGERSSTIGAERVGNVAFALGDEEEFVVETASSQPPRPPNMERIVELNRGPFVGAPAPLEAADAAGAVVLDVRSAAAFATGHPRGAINVPVTSSSFATRAAFVIAPGARMVLHASSDEEADRAARGLRAVGFLELGGRLRGATAEERLDPVDLDELERILADGSAQVIDVRESSERDSGYIAGTRHIPYRLVRQAAEQDMCDAGPVVTICETGARAAIAASVLAAAGVDARPVLGAGIPEWHARGGRVIEFRRCGS